MPHILSVNLGRLERIPLQDRMIKTGIYKFPVAGPVQVTKEGLVGDTQVDRKNHGGPDKAIYVYTEENYQHWATARGEANYGHGHFGENLTVNGLEDHAVYIGDIFSAGETILQITQPRVPCFKLGLKFGDPDFVSTFLTSGRTGFYLRVIQEGMIRSGDTIQLLSQDSRSVAVNNAMRALIKHPDQRRWIDKVLAVDALSSAWRDDLSRRLNSH
jgi:MOSC domain-containing protein YiiM